MSSRYVWGEHLNTKRDTFLSRALPRASAPSLQMLFLPRLYISIAVVASHTVHHSRCLFVVMGQDFNLQQFLETAIESESLCNGDCTSTSNFILT